MQKREGGFTYFVPDVAYHLAKWERGFVKVVNIQGTDHHGTIARVRAGLQAADMGVAPGYPDYVLHTMVRVEKDGEEIKISKRTGGYVTLRELIDWTSKDALRFFLLSRKPDTEFVFDVNLAVAKNNENPVYYVQYAHARISKVLRDAGVDSSVLDAADLNVLNSPAAFALMTEVAKFPEMLTAAAKDLAPHDVTFYLRGLASSYHSYYDAERILVDDLPLRRARLALVSAVAQVIRNGLGILGVSAPEQM
jgi:arginyl-tRNA synthetase